MHHLVAAELLLVRDCLLADAFFAPGRGEDRVSALEVRNEVRPVHQPLIVAELPCLKPHHLPRCAGKLPVMAILCVTDAQGVFCNRHGQHAYSCAAR